MSWQNKRTALLERKHGKVANLQGNGWIQSVAEMQNSVQDMLYTR